ncbi:MAG TPA: hypothetical protein VE220_04050 [Gaiellaceae bacterium]|nr:hypothetical protein [Gaiellaceae bacterium]
MLALFACGAVLLSTGCGGGGGQRLSETAFRSRANHICRELNRKEQPDLATNSTTAVDRNLGRINSALSQLKGLHPPTRDESRYRNLLTSFQRSADFVKAHEATLVKLTDQMRSHPSDSHLTAQYRTLVGPFVQEIRAAATDANALGLSACAKGFTG